MSSLPSANKSTSKPAFLIRKFTRTSSTTISAFSVAILRSIHFGKSSAGENRACAISCARITRSTCSSPTGTTMCFVTTLVIGLPRTGAQVSTCHAPESLSLRPNISGSGLISVFCIFPTFVCLGLYLLLRETCLHPHLTAGVSQGY